MSKIFAFLAILLFAGCRANAQDWGPGPEVVHDPSEDWVLEPSVKSFEKLTARKSDFSCLKLREYVASNDPWAAFYAIRDAALFLDSNCSSAMRGVRVALTKNSLTAAADAFFRLKLGDESELDVLLKIFDKEAMQSDHGPSSDHAVVSLLGFFPDWDRTGRRLLRHAKYADGAASEVSGSALVWKKHLYGGDPGYDAGCAKAADLEGVASRKSYLCDPPMPGVR